MSGARGGPPNRGFDPERADRAAAASGTGDPRLYLSASPHLKSPDSTPRIMWTVVGSLAPVVGAAAWFFGISALLVIAASTAGAMLTERVFGRGPIGGPGNLADGSAAITGLLLGLTLPAGMPLWMAFLGGAVGIGFGKLIFGGLGQNIFNPALLGRAFLQAAFPTAITTWPVITTGSDTLGGVAAGLQAAGSGGAAEAVSFWTLRGPNFALPFLSGTADAVTQATPLGLMKFEGEGTELASLVFGTTNGSLGETAGLLILLCGGWLAWKRYLDWRIPVSIFLTVAVFAGILHAVDASYPSAPFMLFSGGLMIGAVYMATDMVTSPVTPKGAWIYGIGIGFLVVLIRVWGGLPEGVMYAILFMNALVPFINRATQPRVFGHGRPARRTLEAGTVSAPTGKGAS